MARISLQTLLLAVCLTGSQVLAADEWWEYGHFYQIYPRSFQDSGGDGIGDLTGITQRLPHLKDLGVTGVWLSPIFESPMFDFGYDISDFRKIQPEYGTMEDFERLIQQCKELDIKLILDFVPNHSSSEHQWFKKASNPNDPEHKKYRDYYIWNEGKLLENGTRVAPSNWLSIFRGSAWDWVDEMQAFYVHQFLPQQPDLNFRNEALSNEMKEVLRFWLRKGVDGFRVDAVPYIFETKENAHGLYDDEPLSGNSQDPLNYDYLDHIYTKELDETFDIIYEWRKVLDEPEFANQTRILMTEGYTTLNNTMRYYGRVENGKIVKKGAQIPFNFQMMDAGNSTTAYEFTKVISDFVSNLPNGDKIQANWVLGNHDRSRIASRFKQSQVDLFNILLKTLPGITITYNGEEIGMHDVYISWEDTVDPQACRTNPQEFDKYSRDKVRTPLQWNSSKNAGFSTAQKTWLPLADDYVTNNIEIQSSPSVSHLKVFKTLISLRENPTMKYGGLEMHAISSDVLVYKRQIRSKISESSDVFVVLLNLGSSKRVVDLSSLFKGTLPQKMQVAVASIHAKSHAVGDIVDTKLVGTPGDAGIVLVGKYE